MANELFFIQKGKVRITKIIDGKELYLAILQAEDIAREIAMLEGNLRDACAIANEECGVMVIKKLRYIMQIPQKNSAKR